MKIPILVCLVCVALCRARRVSDIRSRIAPSPQVYYEDDDARVSSIADEDDSEDPSAYQPRTRALASPRTKDILNPSKVPPVQTIRNYNKVNDDGSFTFGYEAADGSFKEETRGTDCVVRGKYGYIDPDGNKREFTYVSGNPCDPNAPKDDDDDELVQKQEDEEETLGPANYPVNRPVQRPTQPKYSKPVTARPQQPTTIFQNEYAFGDEEASQQLKEEDEPSVLIRPTTYRTPKPRPNYLQVAPVRGDSLYSATPTAITSASTSPPFTRPTSSSHQATSLYRLTTPAPLARYQTLATTRHRTTSTYHELETSTTSRPQSAIAITPRPHVVQVAAQYAAPSSTERPGVIYARSGTTTANNNNRPTTPSNTDIHLNFAAELERYVNTVPAATNRPVLPSKSNGLKAEPIYQSELVFDPSSGQYKTQLYQTLSQTLDNLRVNQKLQQYLDQSSPQALVGLQHQPSQVARPTASRAQPQEAIYRQQQAQQLAQSQQLFAQQQRRQQQQQQQHQRQPSIASNYQVLASQKQPQSYYYAVAPPSQSRQTSPSLTVGQIDQFLRGSTAQF